MTPPPAVVTGASPSWSGWRVSWWRGRVVVEYVLAMAPEAETAAFEMVRVEKQKRPYGTPSSCDDEEGVWLHSPKDSLHHLGNGGVWVVPWHGVQFIPRDARWWVAWFWGRPTGRWTAADVCTPAAFVDGVWSYVDLELDPVGDEYGLDHLADEDEFRDAVAAGHRASLSRRPPDGSPSRDPLHRAFCASRRGAEASGAVWSVPGALT